MRAHIFNVFKRQKRNNTLLIVLLTYIFKSNNSKADTNLNEAFSTQK